MIFALLIGAMARLSKKLIFLPARFRTIIPIKMTEK